MFHANCNLKKAGVTILILDKIDCKPKTLTRDKEEYYLMINRLIHQEDTTMI